MIEKETWLKENIGKRDQNNIDLRKEENLQNGEKKCGEEKGVSIKWKKEKKIFNQ